MKTKILIVEDEQKIMRFIRANLLASNYQVYTAVNGQEAIEIYEQYLPDLILLDIMLPVLDGFQVLSKIREYSTVPIIIITAKGSSNDTIKGLELGADDYIIKPFDINELLARTKAVLRRCNNDKVDNQPVLEINSLYINLLSYKVKIKEEEVKLNPTEFKLLVELAKNSGCVLTHEALLSKIWGSEYRDETHYLRVCVARLRQKLAITEKEPGYIQTIPTVGYKMLGELQEDTI